MTEIFRASSFLAYLRARKWQYRFRACFLAVAPLRGSNLSAGSAPLRESGCLSIIQPASLLAFAGWLFSLVFFLLTEVLPSFKRKCLGVISVHLELLNGQILIDEDACWFRLAGKSTEISVLFLSLSWCGFEI